MDRFWRRVVKGPGEADCWLWSGAVGDDGYGRFWLSGTGEGQRVMRPQRFLYREVTGVDLSPEVMLLHRCDVPLCVRFEADPFSSHLRPGTAAENQRDAAHAGRTGNRFTVQHWSRVPRAERVERSRRVRDVLRTHGWDSDLLARALSPAGEHHPTLW